MTFRNKTYKRPSSAEPKNSIKQVQVKNVESFNDSQVVEFLKDKLSTLHNTILSNISFTRISTSTLLITATNATSLLRLNGIRLKTVKLDISIVAPEPAANPSFVPIFESLITSRFDQSLSLLNLSNIQQQLTIDKSSKSFTVFLKIVAKNIPTLKSLTLDSNNIQDLSVIESLPSCLPNLENLSLVNNNIQFIRNLDGFNGNLFIKLKELVLLNNPICLLPDYRAAIRLIFPTITILDQTELKLKNIFPIQFNDFYWDSGIESSIVEFLKGFFILFDGNRMDLRYIYNPIACFSVSVNTYSISNKSRDKFKNWIKYSRNMTRTQKQDQLLVKSNDIIPMFQSLPKTRHDMNSFKVSSYQTSPTTLMVCFHGVFQDELFFYGFDRVFCLVPAGESASSIGSRFEIVNDMLLVRDTQREV